METVKIKRSVSFYDPTKPAAERWQSKDKEVDLAVATTQDEALQILSGEPKNMITAANLFAKKMAEADFSDVIPETCFTSGQVSAITKAFKAMPNFAGLKSTQLKNAVMAYGVDNNMSQPWLTAFAPMRGSEEEDSE